MQTKFIILVSALCLSACTSTVGKVGGIIQGTTPVVERSGVDNRTCRVFKDTGGNPFEYEALRDELVETCDIVELGECNSSCTMLMTLPNACLIEGKRFGFHSSNVNGLFNGVVSKYYRAGILERYEDDWSNSSDMSKITSEEAILLDPELELCE